MLIFALLSFLVFGGFVLAGVLKHGLLGSYSEYAAKWGEFMPLNGSHLWSLVTFAVAFLLLPAMIEAGASDPAQCLGFFAPLYLIVVSFTPEYQTKPKQRLVHEIGALCCAVFALAWIVFVCHCWPVVAVMALAVLLAACITERFDAFIFWGEMALFASTYITLYLTL